MAPLLHLTDDAPGQRRRRRPPANRPSRPLPSVRTGVLAAVGNTPLVRLDRLPLHGIQAFAKLEGCNPGGSMKDRPALTMIEAAVANGSLTPGGTIVESSSGNLGAALAQAGAVLGFAVVIVADELTNHDTIRRIRALGATVEVVRSSHDDARPLLRRRMDRVAELCDAIPDAFWPSQYSNLANPRAHQIGTMREIDVALGGRVDVVVVPVSTTGTLRGCWDYLREHRRATTVVAVDVVGSALFGHCAGRRVLPGVGAGVPTELSERAQFDELIRVDALDSVVAARRLARREGILAGGSSGAALAALGSIAPNIDAGARCAVILPDSGGPYLRTVFDDEWVEAELGVSPPVLDRLVHGTLWTGHRQEAP